MKLTSVLAFKQMLKSGAISKQQFEVLKYLKPRKSGVSATEVAIYCGIHHYKRLSELERKGLVSGAETFNCPVTGNKVTKWVLTGGKAKKVAKKVSTRDRLKEIIRFSRLNATNSKLPLNCLRYIHHIANKALKG